MNNKKKIHPILKILLLFFIAFVILYIANASGYYESRVREKVTMTDAKIKDFEEKIANGEEVDLDSYLKTENTDYNNKFSRLGDNLTNSIEVIVMKSSEVIGDILKSLF